MTSQSRVAFRRRRVAAPGRTGFQRHLNVGVRRLPRRPQAEKYRGDCRDKEGESEHAQIE